MTSTSTLENLGAIAADSDAPGAADDVVFAHLQSTFAAELKNVLSLYLENSDAFCERLQQAAACAHWQEAVRVALAIGHEADALGFHRVATSARTFADATYHTASPHALRDDAQMVVLEYERFRLALAARFPSLVSAF